MTQIKIVLAEKIGRVNPNIFGHFVEHLGTCIYEGIYVGEHSKIPNTRGIRNDVIEALKRLHPPVLRWPGGCFADDYHWKDGIGPKSERSRTVNIHWGSAIESNHFGTHEFVDFCRLIGAEPYISANVGSGTPKEARDWIEYCNFAGNSSLAELRAANGSPKPFNVRYWGVGNELWGCGGAMPPEEYALQLRRFATFMKGFGTDIYRIACGPRGNDPYEFRRDWVLKFFERMQPQTTSGGCRCEIDGFALHFYTRGQGSGGSLDFTDDQYYWIVRTTCGMEERIKQVRAAMDTYDPERRVGLVIDEWGTWYPEAGHDNGLTQQNTVRDALVAALNLDMFVRHADKVVMTNIAQTVNVLQAMILTDGAKMLLTPSYHVFDMYQAHQGATAVRTLVDIPAVSHSVDGEPLNVPKVSAAASVKEGTLFVTLSNVDIKDEVEVDLELLGAQKTQVKEATLRTLCGESVRDHNAFDDPNRVKPAARDVTQDVQESRLLIGPHSVNALEIRF